MSGFEDKVDVLENSNKGKEKRMEKYEQNIQDLWHTSKRPNLEITSVEEREEVQAKGTEMYSIKIIAENLTNLEKVMVIQGQEALRTPTREYQNRIFPHHMIVKTLSIQSKERI